MSAASAATAASVSKASDPHKAAPGIRSGVVRAVVVGAGAILCVLAAVPSVGYLTSVRGVPGPTVLDATHPVSAIIAVVLTLAVCTAIACVVGRLVNAAVGLFVLGCGVAYITMQCGSVFDAAFDNDSLQRIAFGTLAWAGALVAMSAVVYRVSGPLPDVPAYEEGGPFLREVFNADALRGLLVGLVSVGAVWLLMRNDLKGQAIGSAVFAGVGAALAGRKLNGRAQPILLMGAPALFIGLAQMWTAMTAKAPFDVLLAADALPGWSRIMPMDVAAGVLIGVPIGLGWSRSTAEE